MSSRCNLPLHLTAMINEAEDKAASEVEFDIEYNWTLERVPVFNGLAIKDRTLFLHQLA